MVTYDSVDDNTVMNDMVEYRSSYNSKFRIIRNPLCFDENWETFKQETNEFQTVMGRVARICSDEEIVFDDYFFDRVKVLTDFDIPRGLAFAWYAMAETLGEEADSIFETILNLKTVLEIYPDREWQSTFESFIIVAKKLGTGTATKLFHKYASKTEVLNNLVEILSKQYFSKDLDFDFPIDDLPKAIRFIMYGGANYSGVEHVVLSGLSRINGDWDSFISYRSRLDGNTSGDEQLADLSKYVYGEDKYNDMLHEINSNYDVIRNKISAYVMVALQYRHEMNDDDTPLSFVFSLYGLEYSNIL